MRQIKNKNGKTITLLNPSEKGNKFATELREDLKLTNTGVVKMDKNGVVPYLTDSERAYRAGYLAAQRDSANCYNAKHGKKKKKGKKDMLMLPPGRR